ncbi:MAG: hypothetical protein IPK66_17450 [Rhodospirillales bacterium]|nr:hypothetical protein [Rhodospirillales bacterium]
MESPAARDIVLVGDIVEDGPSRETIFDWDNPTWPEVEQVRAWILSGGRKAEVISSVRQFASEAERYQGRIVLPLWRGGESRSRTAIVPAICEALDLTYIGADAYAQAACQDKSLSKHLLRAAGIDCALDIVVHSDESGSEALERCRKLQFPVVVKPLYSACSIGVEDASFCEQPGPAMDRAKQLFEQGLGPVIIEPFLRGEEISLCVIESEGEIDLRCISVFRDERGECPFAERLLTMSEKISADRRWMIGCRHTDLGDRLWERVRQLIRFLGPVGPLRVDGRICGGRFVAIELTPDIHLGLDSPFLGAFGAAGISPASIIDAMIRSAPANRIGHGRRGGLSLGATARYGRRLTGKE